MNAVPNCVKLLVLMKIAGSAYILNFFRFARHVKQVCEAVKEYNFASAKSTGD